MKMLEEMLIQKVLGKNKRLAFEIFADFAVENPGEMAGLLIEVYEALSPKGQERLHKAFYGEALWETLKEIPGLRAKAKKMGEQNKRSREEIRGLRREIRELRAEIKGPRGDKNAGTS